MESELKKIENELLVQGFKKNEAYFQDISEIIRFRRDFIHSESMNLLQRSHPTDCYVIFWVDLIDNSDLGYGLTYRGSLGVYSNAERTAGYLLGGFGDSSPWCLSIDEAQEKAVIDYLSKEKINIAYRNREDCWRRKLLS